MSCGGQRNVNLVKSQGPPSTDPATQAGEVAASWPDGLRRDLAGDFSLALCAGGSADDLAACAANRGVTALDALVEGEHVSSIGGASEFMSTAFRELYAEGLLPATPLFARREPRATVTGGDATGN